MAKNAQQYHDQGKADFAAVKLGNHYSRARYEAANAGTGWQSRAYMQGWQEAQDIEDGYYAPAAVWMRTAHADRLALLHRAKLGAWLAGRAFDDIGEAGQKRLTRVMAGEEVVSPVADGRETMGQLAARVRMIDANRKRAEYLRRKFGYIASMDSVYLDKKVQGPRHAPGVQWPNGERIARSQFRQRNGDGGYVWQWAAFDEHGSLIQVLEADDLWQLRTLAAYYIADGSREVRSHRGH